MPQSSLPCLGSRRRGAKGESTLSTADGWRLLRRRPPLLVLRARTVRLRFVSLLPHPSPGFDFFSPLKTKSGNELRNEMESPGLPAIACHVRLTPLSLPFGAGLLCNAFGPRNGIAGEGACPLAWQTTASDLGKRPIFHRQAHRGSDGSNSLHFVVRNKNKIVLD